LNSGYKASKGVVLVRREEEEEGAYLMGRRIATCMLSK